jgi:hypothetical protein
LSQHFAPEKHLRMFREAAASRIAPRSMSESSIETKT